MIIELETLTTFIKRDDIVGYRAYIRSVISDPSVLNKFLELCIRKYEMRKSEKFVEATIESLLDTSESISRLNFAWLCQYDYITVFKKYEEQFFRSEKPLTADTLKYTWSVVIRNSKSEIFKLFCSSPNYLSTAPYLSILGNVPKKFLEFLLTIEWANWYLEYNQLVEMIYPKLSEARTAILYNQLLTENDEIYELHTTVMGWGKKSDKMPPVLLEKIITIIENFGEILSNTFLQGVYEYLIRVNDVSNLDVILNIENFQPNRSRYVFDSRVSLSNFVSKYFKRQEAYILSLTERERKLLHEYTTGELDTVNRPFAKDHFKPKVESEEGLESEDEEDTTPYRKNVAKIEEIQRIISKSPPIDFEFVCFRGGVDGYDKFPNRRVVSTSLSETVMYRFAKRLYGYNLTMRKGNRVLPLYRISKFPEEFEILFDFEESRLDYDDAFRIHTDDGIPITVFKVDVTPEN